MTQAAGPSYIIIQGITQNGRKFRPSDWAERLAGLLANMDQRQRMVYSVLLLPLNYGGVKSVAMDITLEQQSPNLFHQVLAFASSNQLTVIFPQHQEMPQANVA